MKAAIRSLDVPLMKKKFVPEAVIRDYLCERHFHGQSRHSEKLGNRYSAPDFTDWVFLALVKIRALLAIDP